MKEKKMSKEAKRLDQKVLSLKRDLLEKVSHF